MRKNYFKLILIFFFTGFLFLGGAVRASAAPIKILSDGRHAYSNIVGTINQLIGAGHIGTDFIVHSTNMNTGGGFSVNVVDAFDTTTQRYDQNGILVPSAGAYQIFTSSCTGYYGDTVVEYNHSNSNDITHNYAYTGNPPAGSPPPAFHTAPGGDGWNGGAGVEWAINPALFDTSSLSALTGVNAGIMASLRYNHPSWNWFDVKAALRQTGSNWATGYHTAITKDTSAYGFGQVNYATANAFTDNQLLLQPPEVIAAIISGRVTFTLYPFKQTRRVKEVLFQFSSAPAFHDSELTLTEIQSLGGTKVAENTSTSARTLTPVYTALTNAYFVWFTADNSNDSTAHFSRIDTYTVLGPLSQGGFTPPACTEVWSCTPWSSWDVCSNNFQTRTRTCTDGNSCGTVVTKPIEIGTQSCTATYNLANLTQLLADWLKIKTSTADVNNDGGINSRDLGIMMSNW